MFGIAYLRKDGRVVKIEPVKSEKLTDGDVWGKDIVPTLEPNIRQHFMEIYSIDFIKTNPLKTINCIGATKLIDLPESPLYKKTIIDYAGKQLNYSEWTPTMCKKALNTLLLPIATMNSLNYFHQDIHTLNITFNDGIFKIIDYGDVKKVVQKSKQTIFDILRLFESTTINYYIWSTINRQKLMKVDETIDSNFVETFIKNYTKKHKLPETLTFEHMILFNFNSIKSIILQNKVNFPTNIKDTLFPKDTIWNILTFLVKYNHKIKNSCDYYKIVTEILYNLDT